MESLTLSIVASEDSAACVPSSVRDIPTMIIGGTATTASYVRSVCFDQVELAPTTDGCKEGPDTAEGDDISTFVCGDRLVTMESSADDMKRMESLETLQVAVAHLHTIEMAYNAGHEQVLILENDADMALVAHWGDAGLDAALEHVPSDYHILRVFEWNRKPSEMGAGAPSPFSIETVTATPAGAQPVWGAVAYVISRRGMRYLLDRWHVTEKTMMLAKPTHKSVCKAYIFTAECLLFAGPGVYQSHRSLFGRQMSSATRRGAVQIKSDEYGRWMNEASSIDILSSYGLTQAVPDWHRAQITQITQPPPLGQCCNRPTDATACGANQCASPASGWCAANKENCESCNAYWCGPEPASTTEELDQAASAVMPPGPSFPVAVLCRGQPSSPSSALRSLLAARGVAVDSIVLVQTMMTESSKEVAREVGVRAVRSLGDVFGLFPSAPAIVVAQEGLVFSPDFMDFFKAVAPVVERDPTLWTASASNRNALPCRVGDVLALQRAGVFPGPGWLLTRSIWEEQTKEAQQRLDRLEDPGPELSLGREAIYPETPRVSNHEGVYNKNPSLQWPADSKLALKMTQTQYDSRLQARLAARSATHVLRVGEIAMDATPGREFVLWYAEENGENSKSEEMASIFGIWKDTLAQGGHLGVHDVVWHGTRVLLINTLACWQGLLHHKPAGLVALTIDQAVASKPPARACKVKQCLWTVIAGDSNSRKITDRYMDGLTRGIPHIAREAQWKGTATTQQDGCDNHGSGGEWVLSNGDSCHIITHHFISDDRAVAQLAADLSDVSSCGRKVIDPVRADELRPKMPELIWFGHGLSNLPNGGTSARNLKCQDRFRNVLGMLQRWQASNQTQVVWQSNFPLVKHDTVTKEYIEWELACQRKLAPENQIPLFDVASFTRETSDSVNDFHLSVPVADAITKVVDKMAHQSIKLAPSAAQAMLSEAVKTMQSEAGTDMGKSREGEIEDLE